MRAHGSGRRLRFAGDIAGLGTAEGTRVVLGRWQDSPLGAFADVMIERPDGHRILLAPGPDVAEFVSATYTFEEVRLVAVDVRIASTHGPGANASADRAAGHRWTVDAGPLALSFDTGRRTALGRLLRLVPTPLSTSVLAAAADPVARIALRGVRTAGSGGSGRREWYLATDHHAIVSARLSWEGVDLGGLRTVHPPVRFGFGSTPKRPSLTRVVTIVAVP